MKKITIWIAIVSLMSLSSCTTSKIEDISTHTVLNEQVNRTTEINNFTKIQERQSVSKSNNDNSKNFETVIEVVIVLLVTLLTTPH